VVAVTTLQWDVVARGSGDEAGYTLAALADAAKMCRRHHHPHAAMTMASWAISCAEALLVVDGDEPARWPELVSCDKSWHGLMYAVIGRPAPHALLNRLQDQLARDLDTIAARLRAGGRRDRPRRSPRRRRVKVMRNAAGRLEPGLIVLAHSARGRGWKVTTAPDGALVWEHRRATVRSAPPTGPKAVAGIAEALRNAERPRPRGGRT
jgi:hypothetical protein